jgi:hypothetical protein
MNTVNQVAQNNLNPTQAAHSALTNALHNGLNQANTALMAAIAAVTAAAEHGQGPQAAVQGLVANGMDPDQAQQLVGAIVAKTAEESKGFEIPGIQNFLHGLTNQFTQLFSLPPGPPQDIARSGPDLSLSGKGRAGGPENPQGWALLDAAVKGTLPSVGREFAQGQTGLEGFEAPDDTEMAVVAPSSPDVVDLSDISAVPTTDLAAQLGLNDINVADFGPATPGFEAPAPTQAQTDFGPSTAQQDLGPQQTLSPVENISPLPSVEINPQFLDPVGPSIELSPEPTPPQAPAPASNPTISHSPPASQLTTNQAVAVLQMANMPAESIQAFAGAGLSPRRLLALLQEGWQPDRILDMVSRFAQPESAGGRVDRNPYADFPDSENLEDRRGEPPEPGKHYQWRGYWSPDYRDRPARGLEKQLGRDRIPLPSQTLRE